MKKRFFLAAAVAAVIGVMSAVPSQARVVSQSIVAEMAQDQIVEVKSGGRGWGRSHNRGRHLGWSRGKHMGWNKSRGRRGWN